MEKAVACGLPVQLSHIAGWQPGAPVQTGMGAFDHGCFSARHAFARGWIETNCAHWTTGTEATVSLREPLYRQITTE